MAAAATAMLANSNLNTMVLRLPIGMMRLLEIPLAIIAFGTTCGFEKCVEYIVRKKVCGDDADEVDRKVCIGYTFNLNQIPLEGCKGMGETDKLMLAETSYQTSSEFFVFVAVLSMLIAGALLAIYLFKWEMYEADPRLSKIDFAVTAAWTFFWFCASCSWANGVSGLKEDTSIAAIEERLGQYNRKNEPDAGAESVYRSGGYSSLNVSLIAGFACTFLWGANLWFIYKETVWFKARHPGPDGQFGPGVTDMGAAGQYEDLGGGTYDNYAPQGGNQMGQGLMTPPGGDMGQQQLGY